MLSDRLERLSRQVERIKRQGERAASEGYRQIYRNMRDELGRIFSQYDNPDLSTMTKYNRMEMLEKKVKKAVHDASVTTARQIRSTLREVARMTHDGTLEAVSDEVGRTIRGKLKRETITERLQDPRTGIKLNDRLRQHRNRIITEIQEEITRGMARGDSYRQITGSVRERCEMGAAQSQRVVRTEGHRVQAQSTLDALDHAEAQGVVMIKRWITAEDERVRSSHQHMHGQEVPYDDDFVNRFTGGRGPAPGMLGTPEDDINCRCTMVVDVSALA